MNYEVIYLEEKIVEGVTARTKNSDENMTKVIGGLWQSFYSDGIYASIENKVNDKALGIYSDYENDVNGEYTLTVGTEVSKVDDDLSAKVVKVVPKGKYAKFIVKGHMQRAVGEFWNELWKMDLDRSYVCDFEEYQDGNIDNAEIHIYISIN